MLDPDLLNVFSTVAICGLVAIANLTLASRSISAGASIAFTVAFAATGLTWLLAGMLPRAEGPASANLLLINALGATGMVAMCCGFWLRSGRQIHWWFMGSLAALWIAPLTATLLLGLPAGSHLPFAVLSITSGALSSAWCMYRKKGRKNTGDWALAVWLLFVLPVSVGALLSGTREGDSDPGAMWSFYLNFLPTLFTGVGLFSLLGFTLDAAHSSSELARRDGPTGLLNRRAFDEELAIAVERASRYQRALALIALHSDAAARSSGAQVPVSDELAAGVARLLQAGTRRIDVLARTGVGEYTVLLPDTSKTAAQQLARRLCTSITHEAAPGMQIDCRVGVASVETSGYDNGQLLRAARDACGNRQESASESGSARERGGQSARVDGGVT